MLDSVKRPNYDKAVARRLPFLLIPIAFALMPAGANALDDNRFSISLGAFVTDRSTGTRVDSSEGDMGTEVDLEEDLGLDDSDSVFRLDSFYRFSDKHRVDFSAFDLSRSASNRIEQEITWNDTTFDIDTQIDSEFDLTIYKLAYTYSFISNEKGHLGATGGLYIADIGIGLSAPATGDRELGDVTAPLPVLGLRGLYQLSERWALRASAEFFYLEYGDFDGSLTDIFAGIEFQVSKRVDIGLGLNSVSIDVGIDKDSLRGDFDWSYDGAVAYLKLDF